MEYIGLAFQFGKGLLVEQVVEKIPLPNVRQVLKDNIDSILTFLLVLPLQLAFIFTSLWGLGKLSDRNDLVIFFAQVSLFLTLAGQVVLRVLLDLILRVED